MHNLPKESLPWIVLHWTQIAITSLSHILCFESRQIEFIIARQHVHPSTDYFGTFLIQFQWDSSVSWIDWLGHIVSVCHTVHLSVHLPVCKFLPSLHYCIRYNSHTWYIHSLGNALSAICDLDPRPRTTPAPARAMMFHKDTLLCINLVPEW